MRQIWGYSFLKTTKVHVLTPVYRLGLKILPEERLSIIIDIITWITHFFTKNNPFCIKSKREREKKSEKRKKERERMRERKKEIERKRDTLKIEVWALFLCLLLSVICICLSHGKHSGADASTHEENIPHNCFFTCAQFSSNLFSSNFFRPILLG